MSTSEYFEGEIVVTPALNFAELAKARKIALTLFPKGGWEGKYANTDNVFTNYMPLMPDIDESERKTDEGLLTVFSASRIIPSRRSDGGYSNRMKPLMEALIKGLPGHNWAGQVMSIDEYRRSAVRIDVVTGPDTSTVTEVFGKGMVVWDDKSQTEVDEISG